MINIKKYDFAIIGSGVGLSIADMTLNEGLNCALIENSKFGGTCLTRGCIPSKILVHPADVIREAEKAHDTGLKFKLEAYDWNEITKRMRSQINESREIEHSLDGIDTLDTYKGTGEFTAPNKMKVRYKDGSYSEEFKAEKFVIAAGGRPSVPPIPGLNEAGYLDTWSFFEDGFPKAPWESLAIVGGGAVGAEFAHIFSAFGTKVTVIEAGARLIASEEEAISHMLEDSFRKAGTDVFTGAMVSGAAKEGKYKYLDIADAKGEKIAKIKCEQIFIAAGIRSNADLLRTDLAGIELDARGWIKTNEYLETSVKNIWALGDINGKYQFRHKANYEADILVKNLFGDRAEKQPVSYDAVPWAVFSHPQIAHVGLTEKEAVKKYGKVLTSTRYYSSVAKGFAMGYTSGSPDDGFVKLITDKDLKILGAHIIGPQASVLIQPFVYLMNAGYRCVPHDLKGKEPVKYRRSGTVEPVMESMVIHPSLSEVAAWVIGGLDWAE